MSLRVLQAKCACGGTPGPTGECAQCRARRLAQASVQNTLSAPAQSLDRGARAGFERAWGHDLSAVRIHADDDAARSAEALGAQAYTVGSDVVFGRGRYAPGTDAGQRLLAHELTHVRQQTAAAATGAVALLDDRAAEEEADRAPAAVSRRVTPAVQRQLEQPATEAATDTDAAPVPADNPPASAAPAVSDCDPARALTWADFTGTPPAGTTDGAFTSLAWSDNGTRFRSVMDPAASWVVPTVSGAGARATNGCAPEVRDCRAAFDGLAPGSTVTVPRGAPTGCPASAFTNANATTRGECETAIGAACDADARSESARLLRHEQLHYDIGCTLVRRANGSTKARDVIRTWLTANFQPQQTLYDTQTQHGCIAAQQTAWETRVAGGLTAVTGP